MTTPLEIKQEILMALSEVIDNSLREIGFTRRRDSLSYVRSRAGTEQRIIFIVDFFPTYQPGAKAHIHPAIQLKMSEISRVALELAKNDRRLLADAPDLIANQPIEFTAPKDAHERWFASDRSEYRDVCQAIKRFLFKWVIPFLSETLTPEDLVKLYETNDERIMKQRHWYIFIAAAYLILGRADAARKVVSERFASPGLRKKYSAVFDSLR